MAKKLYGTDPDQVPTNADLGTMAYQDKDNVNVGSFTSSGIDDNATSTAMTLDSNGNLLVGLTSSTDGTNAGVRARADGFLAATREGSATQPTAFFNKKTNDGDIVGFYKDGSTVGSIGVTGSGTQPYFVKASTGGFKIGNDVSTALLLPVNADGSNSDGGAQLGTSSNRFKDLYLSGGVYLGGTGSANHLDDYEEGTWTPSFENGTFTYANQRGYYLKVGNLVSVSGTVAWTARSGSGAINIITLPFTPLLDSNNYRGGGSFGTTSGLNVPTSYVPVVGVDDNLAKLFLRYIVSNSTWQGTNVANLSTSGEIQFSTTYRT